MCELVRPICVSVADACKLLGVKKTTLFRLLKEMQLVHFLIGSKRVIMLDSIDDYVGRQLNASRK